MIREKDLRGAQVWMVAVVLMSSLMVRRLEGRNISLEERFVIIRVLEGGVGVLSGGRLERSRERFGERERREAGLDDLGDDSVDDILRE